MINYSIFCLCYRIYDPYGSFRVLIYLDEVPFGYINQEHETTECFFTVGLILERFEQEIRIIIQRCTEPTTECDLMFQSRRRVVGGGSVVALYVPACSPTENKDLDASP